MDTTDFATQREPRLRLLIPLVVATAFLMEQLDATILTTAIPAMARGLATTPLHLSIAVSMYVLTVAVFIPVSGWFADRWGTRRVFIAALTTFTAGSMLCGLATNLPMLVAFRILQGFGGAMMTPVGRLILLRSFPRSDLVTAMTYTTLPAIAGPIMGPLAGGFLTTYASWRWIFYVNIPFGIAGIALATRYLRETSVTRATPFDIPGFVLFGGGIALLQFALDASAHRALGGTEVGAMLFAGVALLLVFGLHARRNVRSVVDLRLFRQRAFAIGSVAGGLCRVAMNAGIFLLPLMLQLGLGMSAAASGGFTFLGSLGAVFVRMLVGALLRRFGFVRVLTGSAVACAALLASMTRPDHATPAWVLVGLIVTFGLARSMQFMGSNSLTYADVPPEQLSAATSLGGLLQQLTVSVGVSFAALLLTLTGAAGAPLDAARFHHAFLIAALLPLLAVPAFLRLRPVDGAAVSGYAER